MPHVETFAVDVGSLLNIGWWRSAGSGGTDLDELVTEVSECLDRGLGVALGFEAPLFVPRVESTAKLNKQRLGDKGRPWCAGAGTGALALGIQQAAYVFERIGALATPRVTFALADLIGGDADLLIWEAFVSGKAKNKEADDPHVDDARVAVAEFVTRLASGDVSSDIDEPRVLSLVAAGLLASGLSTDLRLLTQPCLVVRAPDLVAKEIRPDSPR